MQRCPKCGRHSYEYHPNWGKRACLRTACGYMEETNEIRLRRQRLQISLAEADEIAQRALRVAEDARLEFAEREARIPSVWEG